VEKIVSQLCKADSTVYVCPADFSTASVLNCAKAIVTIQGTVGLEFSCMGIPIIITGKAFYSGFGFTHEPETKEEYFTMLRNVKNIEPLGDDKMDIAKCVYAAFFEIQKQDFALIDTKLKALTWGIGVKQDVDEAFKLMTERLENTDPRNMVICSEIRKYFQT
jgi:hypothetical protein